MSQQLPECGAAKIDLYIKTTRQLHVIGGQASLAKNNTITVPRPPYSPDLSPCDFFLFRKMKRQLKWHRFDYVEKIQE